MLNTPESAQTCSSSPISARLGSVESVLLSNHKIKAKESADEHGPDNFFFGRAIWKGNDSRLSRPAQPKEQRHVSLLLALVRTRVQTQVAKLDRLDVVHHAKDALLHFPRVLRAEDDHLHPLKVDLDRRGGRHARGVSVGGKGASVENRKVWLAKVFELGVRRSDEHVVLTVHKSDDESQQRRRKRKKVEGNAP